MVSNLATRSCGWLKRLRRNWGRALLTLVSMPPLSYFPPSSFTRCSSEMLRRAPEACVTSAERRFRGLFGTSPAICATVWSMLGASLPRGAAPSHLLWALLFLKNYATEHVNSSILAWMRKHSESGVGDLLN